MLIVINCWVVNKSDISSTGVILRRQPASVAAAAAVSDIYRAVRRARGAHCLPVQS